MDANSKSILKGWKQRATKMELGNCKWDDAEKVGRIQQPNFWWNWENRFEKAWTSLEAF